MMARVASSGGPHMRAGYRVHNSAAHLNNRVGAPRKLALACLWLGSCRRHRVDGISTLGGKPGIV